MGHPLDKGYVGNEKDYERYYEKHKNEGVESPKYLISFANDNPSKEGDYILMTYGFKVVGAGKIKGCYQFDHKRIFDDLDEWGWPHYRRVEWLNADKKEFRNWPELRVESRFSKVNRNSDKYIKKIQEMEKSLGYSKKYQPLPTPEELSQSELEDILNGLNKSYNKFCEEKRHINEVYENLKEGITETETTVYMVLPLLKLLGWNKEMNVRLEEYDKSRKHRDITLYKDKEIKAIIEVKKAGKSLFNAGDQVFEYCDNQNCKTAIVTDGLRYAIFKAHTNFEDLKQAEGDITDKVYAYLNLNHLDRKKHPIYSKDNGSEAALRVLVNKN